MKNITKLTMTCRACPSQWEGITADGERVYGRYRWGHLTLDIDDQQVFGEQVGDGLDGVMGTAEFLEHISGVATYAPVTA